MSSEEQRFKEMVASEPFQRLQKQIAAEEIRAVTTCSTSDSEREIWRAQGAAHAWRTARNLPKQILDAMANKKV
ncbi:MAG TPA: hypothetical protein VN776_16365 [Terracidiphilus sp.]|nr:hypothetical protein [Terracidiphilus sp.]